MSDILKEAMERVGDRFDAVRADERARLRYREAKIFVAGFVAGAFAMGLAAISTFAH